jgi:hypothetical protein
VTITQYPIASAPGVTGAFSFNFGPWSYLIEANGIQPLPGASVTLIFPYDPADIPNGYTEADLIVTYYDGSAWQTVPTTLDTLAKTLKVVVDHFSWWAPAVVLKSPVSGQVNEPRILRNPVTDGNPAQIRLNNTTTTDVRVRVYSGAYRLLRDLTVRDVPPGGTLGLSLKDDWSGDLPNGLYIVKVETDRGGDFLKLLILR